MDIIPVFTITCLIPLRTSPFKGRDKTTFYKFFNIRPRRGPGSKKES